MSKKQSSMSDFLLVPINLQTFLVGKPASDPLYDLAPVPREEAEVLSWHRDSKYSFSFQSSKLESQLKSGVHLHWALPVALMHSRHEGGNKPEQACIPNRWLVLRMWHAGGKPEISSKAWVLESDYVSPDATFGGTPFPFFGASPPSEIGNKHVGYVGRTVPLEKWAETHREYRFDLKSHGWGDPSFAAYYPACKGVLGFHDKMDGVNKNDLLTYLVIGWYSDPDKDPLNIKWKPSHVYGVGDIITPSNANGHQYRVTTAGTSGSSEPSWPTTGTVTNGTVVYAENGADVLARWEPDHVYGVGDTVTPSKPNGHQYRVTTAGTSGSSEPSWPTTGTVTNGNAVYAENGADVLAGSQWSCSNLDGAALPLRTLCHGGGVGVTWQGPDHPYPAESVGGANTAVAIGGSAAEALVAMLAEPDQKKSLQQVLCAFQLGQATQVSENYQLGDLLHRHGFGAVPGGKHWSVEPADSPAGAKSTLPPVSAKVQNLLRKLNEAQQELDRHARKIESLRSRLFDCWATWASKQTGPRPRRPSRSAVDPAATIVAEAIDELPAYKAKVEVCKASAIEALRAENPGMQLAESTMPPFLQPKDPFVVLKGDKLAGVDRAHCQRSDENANGAPLCRLAKDVLTGVRLAGTRSGEWKAEKALHLDFPGAAGTPLGEVARGLALEALLFDPNCASLIVTGSADPSVLSLFNLLQNSRDQSKQGERITLTWDGQPPDELGITRCGNHNPWLPVYLMWQVGWAPTYTPGKGSDSHSLALEGWQLDSGDLVPQAGPVQPRNDVLLEGATIISAMSGAQLDKNLKEFAKTAGLRPNSIHSTQFLGQSLGGLNDLLLRHTLGLFLPPVDPTSEHLDMSVWKALGEAPQPLMPVTGTFLPVRAGALKLVNLYVVDSFGQTLKLVDSSKSSSPKPKVITSAALPPPPSGYDAGFSPRLAQPARLNFAWHSAEDAASGLVCGWIIPNFLDQSLAVFSASGEPLGALESVLSTFGQETIRSEVKFKWRPIPGSTLAIEKIGNQRLQRFLKLATKFTADEGQAFLELVELVLRRTEGRVPAEDPAMAVLLGRPLVLVHASLSLELQGAPTGYWTTPQNAAWKFETEGFEKLSVPLRLGGMNLSADGLVGYLPENDECLFASEGAAPSIAPESKNGSRSLIQYQDNQGKKELAVACDGQPVFVTLLMDASARVHATTGILPRHSVVLPPEAARQAGLIEETYFGVAPVLGTRPQDSASLPTMPRPSDAFGQWSWATRPDLTAKTWHDIQPADDRARFANDLALTEGWLRLRLKQNHGTAAPGSQTTGIKP
jgi:hypothetical protein